MLGIYIRLYTSKIEKKIDQLNNDTTVSWKEKQIENRIHNILHQ